MLGQTNTNLQNSVDDDDVFEDALDDSDVFEDALNYPTGFKYRNISGSATPYTITQIFYQLDDSVGSSRDVVPEVKPKIDKGKNKLIVPSTIPGRVESGSSSNVSKNIKGVTIKSSDIIISNGVASINDKPKVISSNKSQRVIGPTHDPYTVASHYSDPQDSRFYKAASDKFVKPKEKYLNLNPPLPTNSIPNNNRKFNFSSIPSIGDDTESTTVNVIGSDVNIIRSDDDVYIKSRPYSEEDQLRQRATIDCRHVLDQTMAPAAQEVILDARRQFTDVLQVVETRDFSESAILQALNHVELFDDDVKILEQIDITSNRDRDIDTTYANMYRSMAGKYAKHEEKIKQVKRMFVGIVEEQADNLSLINIDTYDMNDRLASQIDVANGYITKQGMYYEEIDCDDAKLPMREDLILQISENIKAIEGTHKYVDVVQAYNNFVNAVNSDVAVRMYKLLITTINASRELCITFFPYEPAFHASQVGADTTLSSPFYPVGYHTSIPYSGDEFIAIQEKVMIERAKIAKILKNTRVPQNTETSGMNVHTGQNINTAYVDKPREPSSNIH